LRFTRLRRGFQNETVKFIHQCRWGVFK